MEKKIILIQPFTRPNRHGGMGAKQFAHFPELAAILNYTGWHTIQIGVQGEADIGCNEFHKNQNFTQIIALLKRCDIWLSIDSFLQHAAHSINKQGVVIWSVSDPEIFGYKENINLLKDRKYLRKNQFNIWFDEPYNEDAFVSYMDVLKEIEKFK